MFISNATPSTSTPDMLQRLQSAAKAAGLSVDPANSSSPTSTPAPPPGSVKFDTQLLTALLNAQQSGSLTSAGQQPSNGAPGHPQHAGAVAIASSDGALNADELKGQSAQTLADDLVSQFGSQGSLSKSDVEKAYLTGATAPNDVLKYFEAGVDANWDALSGGSQSMSAAQLAAAIAKYQPSN